MLLLYRIMDVSQIWFINNRATEVAERLCRARFYRVSIYVKHTSIKHIKSSSDLLANFNGSIVYDDGVKKGLFGDNYDDSESPDRFWPSAVSMTTSLASSPLHLKKSNTHFSHNIKYVITMFGKKKKIDVDIYIRYIYIW